MGGGAATTETVRSLSQGTPSSPHNVSSMPVVFRHMRVMFGHFRTSIIKLLDGIIRLNPRAPVLHL